MPGIDGTHADGVGSLVAGPAHDRRAGPQARGRRRGLRDVADHVRPLDRPRQKAGVDAEGLDHLARPRPGRQVEEHRARAIGHVEGMLAGEPEAHVVLGQEHVPRPRPGLRLVVAHPEQLAGGEARQRLIAGDGDEALATDDGPDGVALRRRPLVVPEDGRADDLVVLVKEHQAVHLPCRTDGRDGLRGRAGLAEDPRDGLLGSRPPEPRVLLRPQRVGCLEVVLRGGHAHHRTIDGEEDGLGGRR